MVFANLNHLWRRDDVSLGLKGRVYKCTVRATLLYGCETWTLRNQDLQQLQVFDMRCLRHIAKISLSDKISNERVLYRIFKEGSARCSLPSQLNLSRLRWLGHILRMDNSRLPQKSIASKAPNSWKKAAGGQRKTWLKDIKQLASPLAKIGNVWLPGWSHKDDPSQWIDTLTDMARDRTQWRSCCYSILGA